MKPVVGYAGLGAIGAPMAGRILAGGFDLAVWNRSPARMQALVTQGAAAASSPADLASRCDIVFLCVDSAEAIEAIVFGPQGIVAGGRGRLLVDSSTTHPLRTREMAKRLGEATGMGWLDVPVSGGPVGARAGTLAAFVGGDEADLEFARPVIATFAGQITHMGGHGAGQATKACNQVINFATMAAIAEAMSLAERFGMDSSRLPEALAGGFADSGMLREYARTNSAEGGVGLARLMNSLADLYQGRIDPAWAGRMGMAMKDSGIALDLGREAGSPMPLMSLFDNLIRTLHHQRPEGEPKRTGQAGSITAS